MSASTSSSALASASDPFAGSPPRFVRARYYNYTFASWDELVSEGRWWERRVRGSGVYAAAIDGGAL